MSGCAIVRWIGKHEGPIMSGDITEHGQCPTHGIPLLLRYSQMNAARKQVPESNSFIASLSNLPRM